MFEHGLNLFPSRGLDQSILVAVLVGVFVLLFLTEILGWVWAGLVVPGYLASVFVIQPSSGIAICIEATLTFIACRLISGTLSCGQQSLAETELEGINSGRRSTTPLPWPSSTRRAAKWKQAATLLSRLLTTPAADRVTLAHLR